MGTNKDGRKNTKIKLDFETVLMSAMKKPGVKINRAKFLRKELTKYCTDDVITKAIKGNPAKAGIPRQTINKISSHVINLETTKVTGASVVASLPGGVWTVGASVADLTTYFASVLRVVQELAYLYGFPEFDFDDDSLDSETMNQTLLFVGAMFGVQGAAACLHKLADAVSKQVAKKLANKALTKGTVYPIVKKIAQKVGVHMTKQIFADSVASAVPVIGGVVSGGLTFAMFKPNCSRLKKNMMKYDLSNPDFYLKPDGNDDDKDSNT